MAPLEKKNFCLKIIGFLGIAYFPTIFSWLPPLLGVGWKSASDIGFLWPIAMCFFIIAFSLGLIFTKRRKKGFENFFAVLVIILLFIPMIIITDELRMTGFYLAGLRAKPLIIAIEHYQQENHKLPQNLTELIPRYIKAMPYGIPPLDLAKERDGNGWNLSAEANTGALNWDMFIYKSNGNYSEYGKSGSRLGDWLYYHE